MSLQELFETLVDETKKAKEREEAARLEKAQQRKEKLIEQFISFIKSEEIKLQLIEGAKKGDSRFEFNTAIVVENLTVLDILNVVEHINEQTPFFARSREATDFENYIITIGWD